MSITTATPAEIDTEIARIETAIAETLACIHATRKNIERAKADAYFAHLRPIAVSQVRMDELVARINSLAEEKLPYIKEYSRRGGWSRYYLVDNNNGHLHTHMNCGTCYETTQFVWITELSGTTADEAVAQAGSRSCLECFPGHREVIESGRPCKIETPARKAARLERVAKQRAKAEKAAKDGITNPDGSALVIKDYGTRTLKTEVAASRMATQHGFDLRWYGETHSDAPQWKANLEVILPALAHKRGTTVEHERAELAKKVEAKYRRETR